LSDIATELLSVAALAVALLGAIVRPMGLSEAAFALPGALILILTRVVSWSQVGDALRELGPTVLFLAGILLFGHLCAEAGVFDYLGAMAARIGRGQARRLLGTVVALAAGVTAVLTLDATVVLLTPVVLRTTQQLRVRSRPHLYACAHLANSGSLLLPVSNLTNLLAFAATGLSFGRFTALIALPWTVACLLDWRALWWFFRADLPPNSQGRGGSAKLRSDPAPREIVQRVVRWGATAGRCRPSRGTP
jgi:arsenical pump membrane protein